MIKRGRIILTVLILLIIFFSVKVFAGDLFSLQGNVDDSSGQKLSSGGVVVEIWDGPDVAGSNLIYNSTDNFTGSANISTGKFDIVLGSVGDELNLEYGRVYYMDFFVAGENMNFSGQERQPFMSSIGTINSSFLNASNDYTMGSLTVTNITAATLLLNVSHGTDMIIVNSTGVDLGSGLLYVDPITNRVGIGTTAPLYALDVQNFAVFTNLAHFAANVSIADNLTVGGNALYVDSSSGRVGIGTSTPTMLLDVNGDANLTGTTYIGNSTLYVSGSNVGIGTTTPAGLLNINGTGNTLLNVTNESADLFMINETTAAFGDGINVGIGTTAPSGKLTLGSGQFLLPAGSGSAPSLSFDGDTDTGIYSDSANYLFFSAGGAVGFFSNGRLGLYVPMIHIDNNGAQINLGVSSDAGIAYGGTNILTLKTGGTERMRIDNSNVGIGTSSPTSLLHLNISDNNTAVTEMLTLEHVNDSGAVSNGIGSGILFRTIDDASEVENISMIAGVMENVGNGTERGALVFYTGYGDGDGLISNLSSSERMRINTSGASIAGDVDIDSGTFYVDSINNRVGIGTTGPTTSLDVSGEIKSSTFGIFGTIRIGNDWFPGGSAKGLAYQGEKVVLYSYGANIMISTTTSGTSQLEILSSGNVGIGTSSPARLLHLVKSENNETVTDLLSLDLTNSSGDVGNGSGPGIMFRSADNAGEVENISMIAGVMENVDNGTERGALVFYTGYGDGDGLISNLSSSERMRINTSAVDIDSGTLYVDADNNRVGIGTATPTHALTFPQSSTGIALYNTADQETNYERGYIKWSANSLYFGDEKGGSGTNRDVHYGSSGTYLYLDVTGYMFITSAGTNKILFQSAGFNPASNNLADFGLGSLDRRWAYANFYNLYLNTALYGGLNVSGLDTPSAPSGTAQTSGGSMADGTYYYVITTISSTGETLNSSESSAVTISGGGGSGSVALEWTRVMGAKSYKIYRTTTSGVYTTPSYITNVDAASYTDTAASPSTGAPPTSDTSRNVLVDGNVGIGTSTPGATLEVTNTSAAVALFNVSDGSNEVLLVNSTVANFDSGTLFVDSINNRVGIGTTNPGVKLRVADPGSNANVYISAGTNKQAAIRFEDTADGAGNNGFDIGHDSTGSGQHDFFIYDQENSAFRFLIDSTGNVVIGGSESSQNSSMKLTIIGGDLNVSGAVFSAGSVLSSPFVIKSVDEEPIPVCMKNSKGNWVGCMPDENNNWVCAPNRECDEKVLGLETGWKLKSEGLSDEEVDKKVSLLKEKFEQGKSLKDIKDEVRAEIGDMSVLNELDDTKPKFSIQSSSSEVNALVGEVNGLRSENDLLKSELCKKDNTYSWCKKSEEPSEPVQETPQGQPVETPQEPVVNNAPVIKSFTPEAVPVMSIGDSQEFTVTVSDADENDVLTTQWYVNNLPIADQVLDSFTFTATEIGEFEVKVLVADGKDYVTKEWTLTAGQQGKSYGITGAAVSIVNKGSGSLLSWLKSLF